MTEKRTKNAPVDSHESEDLHMRAHHRGHGLPPRPHPPRAEHHLEVPFEGGREGGAARKGRRGHVAAAGEEDLDPAVAHRPGHFSVGGVQRQKDAEVRVRVHHPGRPVHQPALAHLQARGRAAKGRLSQAVQRRDQRQNHGSVNAHQQAPPRLHEGVEAMRHCRMCDSVPV
eukprot:695076-Pyramimonas_sp.AAC.1